MATDRTWRCSLCGSQRWAGSLFDALHGPGKNGERKETAEAAEAEIREGLTQVAGFGLDAGGKDQVVEAAFAPEPPEDWIDSRGRRVTFWPFLVITQRDGRERAVWLPYWHIVEDGGRIHWTAQT